MDSYGQELCGGSSWDVQLPLPEVDEEKIAVELEEEYVRLNHQYDSLRDVGRIEEANGVLLRIREVEEMLRYNVEGVSKPPILPER